MTVVGDCVDAAVAAALSVGIAVSEARVMYSGSSVIVRLGPRGPVARVGGLTANVRDLAGHYGRELAVASSLSVAGAPVVRPWIPAGPFTLAGKVISFWAKAETEPLADPDAAGVALRRCHEALRDFAGALPPLDSLLEEAQNIVAMVALPSDDRAAFGRAMAYARQVIREHGLPEQALHGDAGMGNVLTGGVWHDWEDSCRGPLVWDLASLVSTARITGRAAERAEATLHAYGDAPGIEQVGEFVAIRGLQVLAWSLLGSAHDGQLRASTASRLEWLRAHEWSSC